MASSANASKLVIYAALFGNAAIAVGKFVVAGLTGSSVMFSEGVHSLVDTGNQALLLLGLRRAARPPDAEFPFGHGKEIYFWSFVVAVSIFALGASVALYEGVQRLRDPHPLENVGFSYAILSFALLVESVAWFLAFREFNKVRGERGFLDAIRRGKDPTLFVVLFEDSAALLGLLVALLGTALTVYTGAIWIDALASIAIGLILAGTALWLARETMSLLIGESASPEVIAEIRETTRAVVGVLRVNEVLTLHMGPDFLLVNLSVKFEERLDASTLEDAIERIDAGIKARCPEVKRVFVEVEGLKTQHPTPTPPVANQPARG